MTHQVAETPLIIISLVDEDGAAVDLTQKDVHSWYVKDPDDTEFTLTTTEVEIYGDATNGQVSCRADKTNWAVGGTYRINVYVQFTDTFEYYSDTILHVVKELYT